MAREGGFFSPNRKVSGKDKQVASSMSSGSYGGYIDAGESRGFVSPEQADKMIKNPEAYKMRPSETRYLRESMGLPRAQFFSPSGNEVGQIASATTDLGGLTAQNYISGDVSDDKEGFNNYLRSGYGIDGMEDSKYKNMGGQFQRLLRESYNENKLKQRDFKQDSSFAPVGTDTKVAMGDNLGGYAAAIGGLGSMAIMGANAIKNTIQNLAPKFKKDIDKRINPEANRVSIGDQVGGFLNRVMGISPVAAGTLDANQVAEVSERPKLSYVNPDAKTMSQSEIGEAFRPKNLFGYQDKFGRFDDPGSPLDRDRQETMQRVYKNFTSPIVGDARTIGQIRADQEARMRENARLRNESFQRGERVQQKSADVTYGTNMLSNPAFGFRDKMTDAAKAQYDQSAKDATEMARTDPSLGNVAMQTINRVSGFFGGPQASLESIGERQLRLANKEINRPRIQKEAYARRMLGITNDQLKARNLQRIRANAEARTRAFNLQKAIKASERSARRLGGNIGTGRDGGFGTGTQGKGMPSNPKGFSGYSRKSSPSTGTGTSKSRGGISKSTSRGQGGGPSSRSKGGVSRGGTKSNTGSKKASRGTAGSSSKGGVSRGGAKTNRSKSRRRCDIRTKIDITQLTNPNLIKDDLATIAYFVQELKGK